VVQFLVPDLNGNVVRYFCIKFHRTRPSTGSRIWKALNLRLYDSGVLGIALSSQKYAKSHAIPELALKASKACIAYRLCLSSFKRGPSYKAYCESCAPVSLEVVPTAFGELVVLRLEYKFLIDATKDLQSRIETCGLFIAVMVGHPFGSTAWGNFNKIILIHNNSWYMQPGSGSK
jgi:hypothetical protein